MSMNMTTVSSLKVLGSGMEAVGNFLLKELFFKKKSIWIKRLEVCITRDKTISHI